MCSACRYKCYIGSSSLQLNVVFPLNIENRFRYLSNGPSVVATAQPRKIERILFRTCGGRTKIRRQRLFSFSHTPPPFAVLHVDFGFPIKRRNISASQCVPRSPFLRKTTQGNLPVFGSLPPHPERRGAAPRTLARDEYVFNDSARGRESRVIPRVLCCSVCIA